jgi:hypothetical protein
MVDAQQTPSRRLAVPSRFGGTWAKIEIFLGLVAAGSGLLLGSWQVSRGTAEIDWAMVAGALFLFVFGGYLTLAGQRSHLYRSNMELGASLIEEIHHLKHKVDPQ